MKREPLVSVIVPIYNVEKYLRKSVDSIINQSYKNLEIILVDDGSPDSCPCICEEYAEKDSRVKVIHKENGGLSDARNAGTDIATGEYISYIDSDDWIDSETIKLTLEKMLEVGAEIGAFNVLVVYEGEQVTLDLSEDFEVMNSEQAIETTMRNTKVRTTAWNKIYKAEILKDLRFPKGRLNEDEFFTFRALDRAEKIVYIHRQCYYYFQRKNSIMGEYKINRLDMIDGVHERMLLIEEKYPTLYSKAKTIMCEVCLYHYQLLLKNKDIDRDNAGRKKIKEYRRQLHITLKDVSDMKLINKVTFLMSNSSIGLVLAAKIRNALNYGI